MADVPAKLSGDTEMTGGRPAGGGDFPRPMPSDPPGTGTGGWMKVGAPADGGWAVIDKAGDGSGWPQT